MAVMLKDGIVLYNRNPLDTPEGSLSSCIQRHAAIPDNDKANSQERGNQWKCQRACTERSILDG